MSVVRPVTKSALEEARKQITFAWSTASADSRGGSAPAAFRSLAIQPSGVSHDLDGFWLAGAYGQGRGARILPRAESLLYSCRRADQRFHIDPFVRDGGFGLFLAVREIQLLNAVGGRGAAPPENVGF